jgi:hypothetical protein
MKSADSVDVGKRTYDFVISEVISRRASFLPRREIDPAVSVVIGKIEAGSVWFVPNRLEAILSDGGYNLKVLEQYCIHNDLMIHDPDRPNRKTASLNGIKQKGICIRLPITDAETSEDDADDEMPF